MIYSIEPKKVVYSENILHYKEERICYKLTNFTLNSEIFKLIEKIFTKLVGLMEKKNPTNEELKRIDEIYGRFKYLFE